nr:glycosyltransferase [Lysobacter sp. GX 14042]
MTDRLAALGHEVHVLAPDIGGSMEGLPDPGRAIQVHRTFPGPVRGALGWLARRRPAPVVFGSSAGVPTSSETPGDGVRDTLEIPAAVEPPRLNWKGRLLERFQRGVSWLLFPDLRAEWHRPARKALHRLLDDLRPDVVVTSHEPCTTLQLGLQAERRGFRWVVDMGDPVLAAYTPWRWRHRAHALEATVMRRADHVLVTTAQAAALLRERHGAGADVSVVTQGFDERMPPAQDVSRRPDSMLELLYAGSFYSFRDPRALVDAVLAVPGVRLNVASGNVPEWLAGVARERPAQVRLLGRVPHRRLLVLQRQIDVLVNLANPDPSQVPGKFYEYLGAGRPVLHLLAGSGLDATGELLGALARGWSCAGDRSTIEHELHRLAEAHREGALASGLQLGMEAVESWSWTQSASAVAGTLQSVVDPV